MSASTGHDPTGAAESEPLGRPVPVKVLQRWLVVQSVVWLPVLALVAAGVPAPPAGAGVLGFTAVLVTLSFVTLWRALGSGATAADWVTLARFLALPALLAAATSAEITGSTGSLSWPVWTAALLVVLTDLVDGWVARRFGGSEAGAILDMETDQLATLTLSILAASLANAGPWVLLLPAFKYGFVLAMRVVGAASHEPKPVDGDNRRARLICALVMTSLLVSLAPVVPVAGRRVASGLAVLLLAYSFSSDAAHLVRAARRLPARG